MPHLTRFEWLQAVYKHNISSNDSWANISHFKIIDQDNKLVAREAREASHIRNNNHAINHKTGIRYIAEIFLMSLTKW